MTSIYEAPRNYRRFMSALAAVSFAIPALAAVAHAHGLLSAAQSRRTLAILGWGLGALIVLVMTHVRLILTPERLICRGLWRTRSVARDDLVGFRIDRKHQYWFHVAEGFEPPLFVPGFLDFDARFDEFLATLIPIDRDAWPGMTPSDLRGYIQARQRAGLPVMAAGQLLFLLLALGLTDLASVYGELVPWFGVWLIARHARVSRDGALPSPVFPLACGLIGIASFLLIFLSELPYARLNGQLAVLPSLALWAVLALFSWRTEGSGRRWRLLGLTLAWSGYAFAVPVLLNRQLDGRRPTAVHAELLHASPERAPAKESSRSIVFRPPGADAEPFLLHVTAVEFRNIVYAGKACVRRHPGAFGIEWWDACDDRTLAALERAESKTRRP